MKTKSKRKDIKGQTSEAVDLPPSCSAFCGWVNLHGAECGKPAIAVWTILSSTPVCKRHAQEVNRMRMGQLRMLKPNA